MKTIITFLITASIFTTIKAQITTTQIEGILEVYHSNDSTSMFIGSKAGSESVIAGAMSNTVIGNNSGINISNSINNLILGEQSGQKINRSSENTVIGNQILNKEGTRGIFRNTIIGFQAASKLYIGVDNTFIGTGTAKNYSYGSDNTFVGAATGRNAVDGSNGNSIFGAFAGSDSLDGNHNSFFGLSSGVHNTTGEDNCFFGSYSGWYNTTGSSNIYLGSKAGVAFTAGSDNILIGSYNNNQVIQLTGIGNGNTSIGNNTSLNMRSAAFNSILGFEGGLSLRDGTKNTYVGYRSGYDNRDGDSNTFIGFRSGNKLTGNGNVAIGNFAGPQNATEPIHDKLYIDNHFTNSPLIYGEFDKHIIQINGSLKSREIYLESPTNDDGIIRTDTLKHSSDLFLKSNDKVIIDLDSNDDEDASFSVRNSAGSTILNLLENGNLYVDGTLVQSSDINRKYDINKVNSDEVLQKLSQLDINSWKYKGANETHIGPMAQDFYAAFGLGTGETTIATVDADGVALAAIKALARENEALKKSIKLIQLELENIKTRIDEK